MMRGSQRMAVAVRNPEGEIVVHTEPLNAALYNGWIAKIPLLRGLILLWDALGLGLKTLMWSADIAVGEETKSTAFQGVLGWLTGLIGFGLGIGLFMVLPGLIVGLLPLSLPPLLDNLLEGIVRLAIMIGYLWAVGQLSDIKRVFAYHGAEHKTINAYEAQAPLTVEAIQRYSTAHARCGTSFLLTVAVISILVFSPLGKLSLLWRLLSRILAIPLIAGISYEWIRFAARHGEQWWMRWMIAPNLALQRLTTREPQDEMVAVAARALETVLEGEKAALKSEA
ncbi:MAG: DUF1385 domain-containing protein [Anaerolineae bacterium]|nr:DUF1385 domain-containing protein [Anaerolineae bacterium]